MDNFYRIGYFIMTLIFPPYIWHKLCVLLMTKFIDVKGTLQGCVKFRYTNISVILKIISSSPDACIAKSSTGDETPIQK